MGLDIHNLTLFCLKPKIIVEDLKKKIRYNFLKTKKRQ